MTGINDISAIAGMPASLTPKLSAQDTVARARTRLGFLAVPRLASTVFSRLAVPMTERVRLWREDYPHFAADPQAMVRKLEPLKPLVGKETLAHWLALAAAGQVDELFESVMVRHYDPCYARSTRRSFGTEPDAMDLAVPSLAPGGLSDAVAVLIESTAR